MDRITAVILITLGLVKPAFAEAPADQFQPYISEASQRFGIPENWVRSVIAAESGGDAGAVSPKGAIGLMQLMPGTWEGLRSAYTLGSDPFDPHANILAGTAYLKAMYDRFGYPALFAAYNAGEGRYQDFLRTGNPLPEETRAYVAGLGAKLRFAPRFSLKVASGTRLFFALSTVEAPTSNRANSASSNGLFIRISSGQAGEK
ncbi:MAG: lytic transglycosylase domain-containing protein [Alphaproteobacteria bacterium]|nr:lytic transglycosylase domain-containing protein [Alphaproteobacteria bacterium]